MMRVVFMGTPEFAVPTLIEIIGAGHEIVVVYTQPPRPGGRRGLAETMTPVHRQAEAFGLTVETPHNLKSEEAQSAFRSREADVAVVVAYGLLLPQPILDAPVHGCLNFHPSKLPRWRGAAPIQRTIMAGDVETAACVMRMDAGLDTGPVCLMEQVDIPAHMTAGELHDLMAERGGDLMVRALAALERGSLICKAQASEDVSTAGKIDKAEARIDWALPAADVHNLIRGLMPFPGAWCEVEIGGKPERLKILRSECVSGSGAPGELIGPGLTVACGSDAVRLLEVQRSGKQAMDAGQFLQGIDLKSGMRF